ncbi:peroxiredoxin [Sandaracinobacter sp. RS1-74]|uniref:peroxiredoxin n=1 Tax=Sandaracinobacteroides sayramensis TaxID=2913411 RepID=UPI001EDA5516|nr:peroxiredoxin [Sandaracinobacteroides sayramensis]MCG2842149.1 peroxiredoxin [Sandaracinobacteroides sayramensis]
MTIKVGDSVPEATLMKMTADGPAPVDTADLFAGRTVALFAVPGAFTPTCSAKHLPGFIEKAGELAARGVDEIVCLSVNDVFVMGAWAKQSGAEGKISLLADGNGDFSKALGLTMDGSRFGMGTRSQRFSMLVKDGKVVELNVEEPGAFKVSSAEHLLGQL